MKMKQLSVAICLGMLLVAGNSQAGPLEMEPTSMAAERAKRLKAAAKSFRLELDYNGQEDKPFYRLSLSVPEVGSDRSNPFRRLVQIRPSQATAVIDHLAAEGFLDKADDLTVKVQRPPHTVPGYTLTVTAGELALRDDLGWGVTMIRRLDGLRKVLDGDPAKELDLLLGRLSGLRAQWEVAQPALDAEVGREGSQVHFSTVGDTTVIDITSRFGIDKAQIKRKCDEWPKSILVRLHLSGLESFKAGGKDITVEWSVSSTAGQATRMSLWRGNGELAMPDNSPYRTELRIVGGNGKIPLKDGYFEVPLPAKLFAGNPQEITLIWIDFYRN